MNNEKYIKPILTIINLENEDIICSSGSVNNNNGNDYWDVKPDTTFWGN